MICFLFFSEQAKIKAEDECENEKIISGRFRDKQAPREKLFIYVLLRIEISMTINGITNPLDWHHKHCFCLLILG